MRDLAVFVGRQRIGTLQERDDLWRFEYSAEWIDAPRGGSASYDLSPALPRASRLIIDGATNRPVQWFFDNLLPEELLRTTIAREAGLKGEDAFSLLSYLGAESAGSLTMLPADQVPDERSLVRPLSEDELSERIAALPRYSLASRAPKRMSLAGAQHKLPIVRRQGQLFEPIGATPSTHILKPDHPEANTYPASVANEFITMRLARAVGLHVPDVDMLYVPQPVYVIERFDRLTETTPAPQTAGQPFGVQRLHAVDACQLLNRPRTFKHSGATLQALADIVARTTNRLHTRLSLFRWLVFNILVGNDDCHLKNLSFLITDQEIRLAPHYDLLATATYTTKAFADERATWDALPLAIPLPGAALFAEVTLQSLVSAAGAIGVPETTARRIIKEVASRLPAALKAEQRALQERHARAPQSSRQMLAAESRWVRVLESIILRDMLRKISD